MPRGSCPRAWACVCVGALVTSKGPGPVPVRPGLRPCPGHGTRSAKPGRSQANRDGWSPHSRSIQPECPVVLGQMKSGGAGRAGDAPQSKSKTQMGVQSPLQSPLSRFCLAREPGCFQRKPGRIGVPPITFRAALRPTSLSPATQKPVVTVAPSP